MQKIHSGSNKDELYRIVGTGFLLGYSFGSVVKILEKGQKKEFGLYFGTAGAVIGGALWLGQNILQKLIRR